MLALNASLKDQLAMESVVHGYGHVMSGMIIRV